MNTILKSTKLTPRSSPSCLGPAVRAYPKPPPLCNGSANPRQARRWELPSSVELWRAKAIAIFSGDGKCWLICQVLVVPARLRSGRIRFHYMGRPCDRCQSDLAADKIYDMMVWMCPRCVADQHLLTPLTKGDPRRAKLAEFEMREKRTLNHQPGFAPRRQV